MSVLIFDTETTALVSNSVVNLSQQPEVIELFACVVGDERTIQSELEFRCQPSKPIPEEVTKITGIKDADVADCPPFGAYADQVKAMIEGASLAVAHNLSYDKFVINCEMKRLGLMIIWPRCLCTVEATEWLKGYRLNLTSLHEELFGEGFEGAHGAKSDVMATMRCFIELEKRGMV